MYLIEVIPFAKNLKRESLSYFSSKEISLGSIVSIELRNKNIYGLVISKKNLGEEKANLKNFNFKLKKIKGVSKNVLYNEAFIKMSLEIANFFATTPSSVLESLTSSVLLKNISKLHTPTSNNKKITEREIPKFVIQTDTTERFSNYKNIIRGEFVKNKSALLICPSTEDVKNAEETLSKGIEIYTFILHNQMSEKQIVTTWNNILSAKKPVLIITTSIFFGIPRHDIGAIILEKENSSSYKQQKSPYLDIRSAVESYAKEKNVTFIEGDIMLRANTLMRFDAHQFEELIPMKFRSLSLANQSVVDMTKDRQNAGNVFSVLSNDLIQILTKSKEKNENTFIFAGRKGLAPSIVCGDCGTIVECHQCKAPIVLHGKDATKKENFFKCNVCGLERSAGELCKKCNGWKLKPLGIGVETIALAIKEDFPDQKFFILDSHFVKTPKQARKTIEDFYKTPGSILIGTEMALTYLKDKIENTCIGSIDALLSIPDFAIREKVMRTLLRIRSRATQNFLIQTRRADDNIFEFAIKGNLSDFYRDEFIKRKQFNYPPFSLLIKISLAGKRNSVEKEFEKLKEFLSPEELFVYPAFIEEQKGKFVMNGLIKMERNEWVKDELKEKLLSLPHQYKVVVDAESLL